jgi:hypothetical protein
MYKKLFKIGLLITATQFLLSSGCNNNGTKPCANDGYTFAATAFFTPEKEIYRVGDTIFLNSEFSKTLTDLINPSMTVNYSNSTAIVGDIRLYYLDTITRQPIPAKDSFLFVPIIGTFTERSNNQSAGINFKYIETPQSYQFKGGFICQKKGIYGFGVSNLESLGLAGKRCTNADFDMSVTNSNKHLHFHQYAIGADPNDPGLQKTGYDFRVQ